MTTLLAIGDMHLGRLPANLPEDLRSRQRTLGPDTAWERCVSEAIRRRVDAVVLAGDLVEQSRDFFVAYGQLKRGLTDLAEAGIQSFAVAGNHDVHVLPRLAKELDHLRLLGAGGAWETVELNDIELTGWSFPQAEVRQNPLESFPHASLDRLRIGILHCDRDQPGSRHAPVSSADLSAAPVSAWLLGHIHQPDDLTGERPAGYLGSVSALRASETGDRGPWFITTDGGRVQARQLVLAPMRYEAHTLDLTDLRRSDELASRIVACSRDSLSEPIDEGVPPDAMGLRLTLVGRSRMAASLGQAAEDLVSDGRPWTEQGVHCFIDKIELALEPEIEIDRLARQSDPCGLLAQRVLALRSGSGEEYERLIGAARERLDAVTQAREFKGLAGEIDEDELAHCLERAALISLASLIDQRRPSRR